MPNKYVNFISDEHLLYCISNLHEAYSKFSDGIKNKNFLKSNIDVFKLAFDKKFNNNNEKDFFKAEMLMQIDRSFDNAIGSFHQQILGGVKGFKVVENYLFDIKSIDDTMYFDIHYSSIKKNLLLSQFESLAGFAQSFKQAKFYFVEFWAEDSFNEIWRIETEESRTSHKNVYRISKDKFYALLTGEDNAFQKLLKVLPTAIEDYLISFEKY